jgi:hypothetical protein
MISRRRKARRPIGDSIRQRADGAGRPTLRLGGIIVASDRMTGILETRDAAFAEAMRALAKRDSIVEVP